MQYHVETNSGTHPGYPDWTRRGSFASPEAAFVFAADQQTDSSGRSTTFGLNGIRVVDDTGREYLGEHSAAVIYGGAKPGTVAEQ